MDTEDMLDWTENLDVESNLIDQMEFWVGNVFIEHPATHEFKVKPLVAEGQTENTLDGMKEKCPARACL